MYIDATIVAIPHIQAIIKTDTIMRIEIKAVTPSQTHISN